MFVPKNDLKFQKKYMAYFSRVDFAVFVYTSDLSPMQALVVEQESRITFIYYVYFTWHNFFLCYPDNIQHT